MQIALFGRMIPAEELKYVQKLVDKLVLKKCGLLIYRPFYEHLEGKIDFHREERLFSVPGELPGNAELLFSIGGDGSILEAAQLVLDSGIPIMGINIGRMGFLSSVSRDEILPSIDAVLNWQFDVDSRTLLKLVKPADLFGDMNYALNDLAITRKDSTSLVVLHVYIDELFLNTYWADGLIIATPTGSTAYSLSSGGPILMPGTQNFVLTPIAPHNLTVRPFVIPDKSRIRIIVEGRANQFMVSLDSRTAVVYSGFELVVEKADFNINIVQMRGKDFFATIREKLKWGLDLRN